MRREVVTIQEGMRIDGLSVIIFVYSSSTSLFDMYRYMYDVDGVIFNQKITEKKIKKLIISKLLIRLVLSYEIFI